MKNIPKDLLKKITSDETNSFIDEMIVSNGFTEEQGSALGNETGRYMLGKTKSDRFVPNLMYRMDINRTTAEAIKEKIDQELVAPVRASFEFAQANDLFSENTNEVKVSVSNQNTEEDNGGVDIMKESPEKQESTETNPKKEQIVSDIENPLHKQESATAKENDSYSNYTPLNVIKDDVLKGIEDPVKETPPAPEESEATELDLELDAILKKPRVSSQIEPDLPTENPRDIPKFTESHTQTPPVTASKNPEQKRPAIDIRPSSGSAYKSGDPYREPIE